MKHDTLKKEGTIPFDEAAITALREEIGKRLSEFRFAHTLGVERMAVRLGELYCPEKIPMLRVAALLHDVTKECSREEQSEILARHGITLSPEESESFVVWHAITAAAILPDAFPEYATPEVVSAVRWHTTGHAGMSLTESLLYLADYIDDTRTWADCVTLRERFWGADPARMSAGERLAHLWRTMVFSFDLTINDRLAEGKSVVPDAIAAREDFVSGLEIKIKN